MMSALARAAYALVLVLLQPVYRCRLWWRGAREPLYRHAMGERFGRYAANAPRPEGPYFWVHAVSLGETRAAASLIEALRRELPQHHLLLTHGTATGREAGAALLQAGDLQCWLPFDTQAAVRRFFLRFRPRVGVLMETEVWPNLLRVAQQHQVPMVLANARLSERSLHKSLRLDRLMRPAVGSLRLVLAQTDADAERLALAGALQVEVAGNLKFDMTPDAAQLAAGRAWRESLERPVVLFASSREGEEALLLDAWVTAGPSAANVGAVLVIVPRHPQRFDEVAALVTARGLTLVRRSRLQATSAAEVLCARVWLGDSMGEMPAYYAMADVALLGGSFAPLGGQNLIEAAACGCPVVMGPHTFNFVEAAELALAAGAALRAPDIAQGATAALALVRETVRREQMSRAALGLEARHRGAARRMARRVTEVVAAANAADAN